MAGRGKVLETPETQWDRKRAFSPASSLHSTATTATRSAACRFPPRQPERRRGDEEARNAVDDPHRRVDGDEQYMDDVRPVIMAADSRRVVPGERMPRSVRVPASAPTGEVATRLAALAV